MKEINEVLTSIANNFAKVAENCSLGADYHIVVCNERAFIDDYKPKDEDFVNALKNNNADEYLDPSEMPYRHTLFFVLKIGQGQTNMALMNIPFSIQCMSEENDLEVAKHILLNYIYRYNYQYIDGYLQSYFTPDALATGEEVYAGFRALLTCKGYLRIPEDGVGFVTEICTKDSDGEWFSLPFISFGDSYSTQPDPQPFAGFHGATMTLNRASTTSLNITTYIWNYTKEYFDGLDAALNELDTESEDYATLVSQKKLFEQLNEFSKNVLLAKLNMNKKFTFMLRTNIILSQEDEGYDSSLLYNGSVALPIVNTTFVLTNASYNQEWGNVSPWTLVFTEAKEVEA